jgi:phytoene dehydrogenase-like protein
MSGRQQYDAVVVGSGSNGLAAAIAMQRAGLSVLLVEAKSTIGGGMRSAQITLPGFVHDLCSAAHPMAVASPFLRTLPLQQFGMRWIEPDIAAAHPLDDGRGAALFESIEKTAETGGIDGSSYRGVFEPLLLDWPLLTPALLGPLRVPEHPLAMARFGLQAVMPATNLAKGFKTPEAQVLVAGNAAHAMQPLNAPTTAAFALVLMVVGHANNWPIVAGGSQKLADALAAHFISLGGEIELDREVTSLDNLPATKPSCSTSRHGRCFASQAQGFLPATASNWNPTATAWVRSNSTGHSAACSILLSATAPRRHRAPRRHAPGNRAIRRRGQQGPSPRATLRPAGAAEHLRREPRACKQAHTVGLLPRAQRFDSRHDRMHRDAD